MKSDQLKRTIGVVSATSIGLGAMLGAGIFVFPGLAGGSAGFAAILSFLTGGIIALAVAFCTAELATAMPKSGGGYFFISRTFGNFWGTLVGIAQWVGLVFACAFYLVSFAEYAVSFLEELNFHWDRNKTLLSFFFTLLLLIINIIGTEKVGKFQNLMVITLTIILVLLFTYGIIDFFGLENKPVAFDQLVPNGARSIFSTTALIFTSYLGFVQIANVGAEIKDPNKNLPRSLIGSVVLAVSLYVFIMGVCISTFSQEELKEFGETATIEVARAMLGNWSAIIVVFGGLLAALSSANASMISASRGVFAMSNDQFISQQASKVNERFGTPHIALICVALPVAIMIFRSELELLAEVASALHLIIYAGICISLLKLRSKNPIWYVPTFRVPVVKLVAGFGAITCLGLIFFMQKTAILISLGVLSLATVYYFLFVKSSAIQLRNPEPPHLDYQLINPKVLIPVDITQEKKALPKTILEAISVSELLLLGYKQTPEQTESAQSEEQFGEAAEESLENIRQQLENSKVTFDTAHIFSNKVVDQVKMLIEEKELQFIIILKPFSDLDEFIIPIYDHAQIHKQLSTTIYNLSSHHSKKIKIILFDEEEDKSAEKTSLKRALEKQLRDVGINIYDFEIQSNKKIAPKKLAKKISQKGSLIVWSEADSTQREALLDLILEKNDGDHPSPSIILLKKGDA